jgi:Zn-dependent protease/CBS domain-containing protein
MGLRVGRIAGIDILIHWSWLAIFFLVAWSLAGTFEDVYPDWTRAQSWVVALVSTLLFFLSVLAHELSHSLVAKRYGLPVTSITLFIFGGVSALGAEPANAGQEFRIAAVGPLTSFVAAFLFGVPAAVAIALGAGESPFVAIAAHVAIANIAVGIFNLLPGFPLDGGRILRAGLWSRTGNLLRATRWASWAGMGLSLMLMGIGVISVLIGNVVGGVWFIVIGWFLRNAAEQSYQQLLLRRTLEGIKVRDILSRAFAPAPPDISLEELVRDYMVARGQRAVPVVVAADLLGLVTLTDLRQVPPVEWATTSVFRAMTPVEKLQSVGPDDDLAKAVEIMAAHDWNQLPVLQGREFLGLVTRADVLRLIQIRTELGSMRQEAEAAG